MKTIDNQTYIKKVTELHYKSVFSYTLGGAMEKNINVHVCVYIYMKL